MYADDILMVAPSVTVLQKFLWACEQELHSIDMCVNVKKSYCMRVCARHEKLCTKITTADGQELEIRYL